MNVTLITGASGGIGEALAFKLAERKKDLLLVARNAGKLASLCQELTEKYGVKAQFIATDLSKSGAPEALFAETQSRKISVEMLVNNAGIGSGGEFPALSLQSVIDMLQLNNASLVALTHLFLPQMIHRKSGTIINVGSMAGFIPIPYMAAYAASKMFVRSFTEAITEECRPHQVHVMLLCPGLTKTNFNKAAGIDGNEKGKGLNTEYNSRTQTPEEVAVETLKALDRKKHFVVSGSMNRLGARITALIPNEIIVSGFAKSYRARSKK